MPSISVIVAAYNEGEHVGRLLKSLRLQSWPPAEIIVVDDGSTDSTAEAGRRGGARVVTTPYRGPALARNRGAALAQGDVLVFLDGDMSAGPQFIERLVAPIITDDVAGTFTKEIFVGNPDNPWARGYAHIRRLPFPRVLGESFPDRWANFRAVRKNLFLAAGGYDDVGYGEDMTLAPKIGAQAVVAPGAECFHFNPSSLREIMENGRWIGRGHDVRMVARPWRDNAPWTVLTKAITDRRAGGSWHVYPARCSYHLGVLLGMVDRRLRPGRHWK